MLPRYVFSLLLTLLLVCGLLSSLPLATRSNVRAGEVVAETWTVEFTLRKPDNQYYTIDDVLKAALEQHLSFRGDGAVQIRSVGIQITPKQVSWTRNKTNYNAAGGRMVAHVTWAADGEAHDGDHGDVRIFFGKLPDIPSYTFVFHSGAYQRSSNGRWMFREVTIWRTPSRVFLGRMLFVAVVAVPIVILLHSIYWSLRIRGEKRRRLEELAALPEATPGTRTFYPNPIAEWVGCLLALFIFAGIGLLPALIAIAQNYQSTSMQRFILIEMAIGLVLALTAALGVRASVVTLRLDEQGIAYARGRRRELRWTTARWRDLKNAVVNSMTYRGNTSTWVELTWPDGRKRKFPAPNTIRPHEVRMAVMELFAKHR
jgi:hypothetical protein